MSGQRLCLLLLFLNNLRKSSKLYILLHILSLTYAWGCLTYPGVRGYSRLLKDLYPSVSPAQASRLPNLNALIRERSHLIGSVLT
jgi:hypothetical protein